MTRKEKLLLLQGRDRSPWLPALGDALYMAAACSVIVLFILAMGGCAEVPRVYTEGSTVFTEGDISPCERGASACTIGGPGAYRVFYQTGDMYSLSHEKMHLLGGSHGKWVARGYENCAQVTVQGRSDWIVGNWLCRQANGTFIQRRE